MEEPDLIEATQNLCETLIKILPKHYTAKPEDWFDAGDGTSVLGKIPFKLMGVIGGLGHRAADFSQLIVELSQKDKTIPSIVLTRSLMETTALLYLTHKKLLKCIESESIAELDNFLIRCMAGNRTNPGDPDSPNVLTAIDHIDKEQGCENYAEFYNALSEFAHPNSMGTFYAYVRFNDSKHTLDFGENMGLTNVNDAAFSAVFALEVFIEFYQRCIDMIPKLQKLSKKKYFESDSNA